jgi:hypothetical protein
MQARDEMKADDFEQLQDEWGEDSFDLDVRILPAADPAPLEVHASGTCGGCPKWSAEGSSCAVTCHTCYVSDPTCDCEAGGD